MACVSRPARPWSACAPPYHHRSHFGSRYQSGRCALRSPPFAPRGFESRGDHFFGRIFLRPRTSGIFELICIFDRGTIIFSENECFDSCDTKCFTGHAVSTSSFCALRSLLVQSPCGFRGSVLHAYLLGLLAMIKCSICSYQCES